MNTYDNGRHTPDYRPSLYCPQCGNRLNDRSVCPVCRIFVPTDTPEPIVLPPDPAPQPPSRQSLRTGIILSIVSAVMAFLIGTGIYIWLTLPDLTDRDMLEILERNQQTDIVSAELVQYDSLSDVSGLPDKKGYMLVYFNTLDSYGQTDSSIALINARDKALITYINRTAYPPLSYLLGDREATPTLHQALYASFKDFISDHGIAFTSDADLCRDYLRSITGPDGFYSCSLAREIIEDEILYFTYYESAEKVLFEEDNANPVCTVVSSSETRYAWEDILPEEYYDEWCIYTDSFDMNRMKLRYGDPYTEQPVWIALDPVTMDEIDVFTSVPEMESVLIHNITSGNNGSDDGELKYRVRKDPEDSDSQLGAYSVFENARKMADRHKDQGYHVYTMDGIHIYTP